MAARVSGSPGTAREAAAAGLEGSRAPPTPAWDLGLLRGLRTDPPRGRAFWASGEQHLQRARFRPQPRFRQTPARPAALLFLCCFLSRWVPFVRWRVRRPRVPVWRTHTHAHICAHAHTQTLGRGPVRGPRQSPRAQSGIGGALENSGCGLVGPCVHAHAHAHTRVHTHTHAHTHADTEAAACVWRAHCWRPWLLSMAPRALGPGHALQTHTSSVSRASWFPSLRLLRG